MANQVSIDLLSEVIHKMAENDLKRYFTDPADIEMADEYLWGEYLERARIRLASKLMEGFH
jgi:hypothetical protein